ncbi:murein transglycosylase A [Emcibacter sp. SYSU 3D8]|uniref:murein transglycosylase A n=1 Tax=Emcibacter sp. SYSU 3D8 TaxID=3133969 RepID=UPI0031FE9DAF
MELRQVFWADLEGWDRDDQAAALRAFLKSCETLLRQPPGKPMDGAGFAGTVGEWQGDCRDAQALRPGDPIAARRFFEDRFRPFAVRSGGEAKGLFTGYYAPMVQGSRSRDETYTVPLHAVPPELVMVDLGLFRPGLKGERIAGKLDGNRLVPFASRGDIVGGALADRGLEIMWLKDPVDAFFLQIQGSGLVRLPDGGMVRLGYAGQNGHPYTAIGRLLVQRGEMTREETSMQSIRAWVNEHPGAGKALMDENASYVFFEEQHAEGAIGAQGVVLTGGRSMAVDRTYMPLGAPLWLDVESDDGARKLNRLVVAQDTGGAIRGIVRGDFYWGEGDRAESAAGAMKDRGRYYILLPQGPAARALRQKPGP